MLDNASIHMSERVVQLIRNRGATVIFGAPYSPDSNRKLFQCIYKKFLRRHSSAMKEDWRNIHLRALGSVDRDTGIKYFRKCGIPGADKVLNTQETEELKEIIGVLLLISFAALHTHH